MWNIDRLHQLDLVMDEEARQRREHRLREEEELAQRVKGMAETPHGRKFFEAYFKRARLFEDLGNDAAAIALHNDALHWLRIYARANPTACMAMVMGELLGEEAGSCAM